MTEETDFYQWKVILDTQILAKTKCPPIQTLTLYEVFKMCNPQDPYSNAPKCNIPISLTCNGVTLDSISSLNNIGNFDNPPLMLAPPFDSPFLNLMSSIPQVPVYDIAGSMQSMPRNDTIAIILLKARKTSSVSTADYSYQTITLDPLSCAGGELTIGSDCAECDFDLVNLETRKPISAMIFKDPQPPPCTVTSIRTFAEILNLTMYKITSANSRAEFEKGINSLNLVKNLDSFVGCNAVIESLLSVEQVPTDIDGDRGCYVVNSGTEQYMSDPCCNQRLLINQCCPERTVTVNISQVGYINYTKLNQTIPINQNDSWSAEAGFVPSPTRQSLSNLAIAVLNQFVQAKRMSSDAKYGCDATLATTIPPNYLGTSTQFLYKCYDIIYNGLVKSGKAAKCSSDLDCYTSCDKQTHKCAVPAVNNSLSAFVACSLDGMSSDVLLLVRDQLGVAAAPAESLPARLASRVQAAVTEPRCYGPDELSAGACVIDVSLGDCHTLQSLFPSQDGILSPDLPQISVTALSDRGADQVANEENDPYWYKFVMFRKDIDNAKACADAGLIWVRVRFEADSPRSADVCRVPVWINTQDTGQIRGSHCRNCENGGSPLESRPRSPHGVVMAGHRRGEQTGPFLASHAVLELKTDPPDNLGSKPESLRSGEPNVVTVNYNTSNLTELVSSNLHTTPAALNRTAADVTSAKLSARAVNDSQGTTSADLGAGQVNPACARRSAADPCGDLPPGGEMWSACVKSSYYFKHCGAQPDAEWFFDPSSRCATFTNRLQFSIMDETLPGMGSCKVKNFGFTNGLLPSGYMSNNGIDWHSPLSFYEDQNFNVVPISALGTSIAETRCAQVKDSVESMGFLAMSSKWYQYDTQTYTFYNQARDEYVDETFPGNQTMCELEKKCNSDVPWDPQLNKSQCSNTYPKVNL